MKKLCKIYKNGKIYFYEKETKKYMLFGFIDDLGIQFNIEKYFTDTIYGKNLEEIIPNPPLEFYIELGIEIKKRLQTN